VTYIFEIGWCVALGYLSETENHCISENPVGSHGRIDEIIGQASFHLLGH